MKRAQKLLMIARREIAGILNKVFSVALVDASDGGAVTAAIDFWNGREGCRENRIYPDLESAQADLEQLALKYPGRSAFTIIIDDL